MRGYCNALLEFTYVLGWKPVLPVPWEDVVRYASTLRTPEAIGRWSVFYPALSWFHRMWGLKSPLQAHPQAPSLFAAMTKLHNALKKPTLRRQPIRPNQVHILLREAARLPTQEVKAVRAFIALAYASFARHGDLWSVNPQCFVLGPDTLTWQMSSKTSRRGQDTILLHSNGDDFVPVVSLTRDWLADDRPLPFSLVPTLRHATFAIWLASTLQDDSIFPHSFRSGALALALAVGLDHAMICNLGRWSHGSGAAERNYARPALPFVPTIAAEITGREPAARRFLRQPS
jgi:integrase